MPNLQPADEVRFKADLDKTGIVLGSPFMQGEHWFVRVKITGANRPPINALLDSVELIVPTISGRSRLLAGEFASLRYLRARLTYEKLANPLRDVLYSLRAARTDFLPHQFKPVLKYLESPANGLLIADEVGLGKTIEAGYILKELRARNRMTFRRVLVVCPAGLRIKWMQELNRRFAESFDIADARKVRELVGKVERDGERVEFALIASYQTLRSKSVRDVVEGLGPINLTIVDEAHHFRNPDTQTHDLAEGLREISDNMIFLSATPVQLGDQNLHALLRLLAPDFVGDYASFVGQLKANKKVLAAARTVVSIGPTAKAETTAILDEMIASRESGVPQNAVHVVRDRVVEADFGVRAKQLELRAEIRELSPLSTLMTRTRKREVNEQGCRREAWQPEVVLSSDERLVYDFYTAESRKGYGAGNATKSRQTSRFRSITLQQQMSSCLPAFLRSRSLGADGLVEIGNPQDIDDFDEELSDEEMAERASKIREAEEVTEAIERILRNGIDSKLAQLVEVIRKVKQANPRGKVVVFSFYKATLRYLSAELKAREIVSELISGDVPSSPENYQRDERARRVERFLTDPAVQVLLSSEVGSEGLDFQEASNVVVHYDLPWNPMKVEQRIGRVDRHLQPHPVVFTVSFAIPGTIEERIRQVLYERIGVFRETIGDLEDILAAEKHKIEHVLMSPELNERQREQQLGIISDALLEKAMAHRKLEAEAVLLVGHDDTFDQELALLEKSGRSVTADEVADFVEGALEADGLRVVRMFDPGRRATRIDETGRLQDFLRKHLPRGMLGRVPLLSEAPGLAVKLDYADQKSVHFVTVHHALTHAALEHRRQSLNSSDEPVISIRVTSSRIGRAKDVAPRPGKYAFAMARLTDIGAVRDSYSIIGVAIGFDGKILDQVTSEQFIQAALVSGEDFHANALPLDGGEEIVQALESAVASRRAAREQDLCVRQTRSLAMRLESRRSQAQSTLRRVNDRINSDGFENRKLSYRTMIRGQQRKLEEDLRKIEDSFRNPVPPTVTHELFGYGLIEFGP